MTDATTHDIMAVELEEDEPAEDVPLETLRSGLESEKNLVRTHAAQVAGAVFATDLAMVKELVPTLIDLLEDERNGVIVHSSAALTVVADDEPSLLEPAMPRLVELLHEDLSVLRSHAARILGLIALEHPEYLTDHVETLVAAFAQEPVEPIDRDRIAQTDYDFSNTDDLERVNQDEERRQIAARGVVSHLLVELADEDPELVTPHVDRFVDLLDEIDLRVVTACEEMLGIIAQENPDAVTDAVGPLCDLLGHRDETVVANAIMALGFVGDEAAVEPLRAIAADEQDHDRSEDLRELASETVSFIED